MIESQDDLKYYRRKHDHHFKMFMESGDFRHFEAAKVIARLIIRHEKSSNAYYYSADLEEMYSMGRNHSW